ncbi:MAG: MmcQ/YjbR family DNA-binding protein [Clostridia bacterium]|nr:MmcQ/YjbR family DNA-binding protein [Clostridia bacterium]
MRKLDNFLKNRSIDTAKLLEYGFTKQGKEYVYHTKIYEEQFEMFVSFSAKQNIAKIVDIANEEEYVLVDNPNSVGKFVGKLREEYENKLQDMIEKCTILDVFKEMQSKEIIQLVKEKYQDDLEFLWKKFPDNAIWRNKTNRKWYAALLTVSERKLGIDSDAVVEIIDLRYQKDKIKELVDNKFVFPGYHMNKDSWITIKLDGSVDTEKILELLENSYQLSLEKK